MKLKKVAAAFLAAGLLGAVGAAQAYIAVDDWQIDLGALGNTAGGDFTGFGSFGAPYPVPGGIERLAFAALYHAVIPAGIAPGNLQHVDLVGAITGATAGGGGTFSQTDTGATLNGIVGNRFELTFASTTTLQIKSVTPTATGFQVTSSHLGAGTGPAGLTPNGLLYLYADRLGDAIGGQAQTNFNTGGAGFQDGLLIAVLQIVDAGGLETGGFNTSPANLDGNDDATFKLINNIYGVLKDKDGNALVNGQTFAFSSSTTDADPDNNQIIDTAPAGFPTSGLGDCTGTLSTTNTCGREDGSLNIAIPEPGSLALLGIALAGLGALRRRGT